MNIEELKMRMAEEEKLGLEHLNSPAMRQKRKEAAIKWFRFL